MTLQDLQQMTLLELLEVCDTDPQHIATGQQVTANPLEWVKQAVEDTQDYLDLKATEANARF